MHTVVPAGVLLGDGVDDEASLAGDHVFLGGELHDVAALAVVVPLHLLPGGDLAETAGQVHALEQRDVAHTGFSSRRIVQRSRDLRVEYSR